MFNWAVTYWFLFLLLESFAGLLGKQSGLGDRIPRIVIFQSIALALFDLAATRYHQTGVVQLYVSALVSVVVAGLYKQWKALEENIDRRWHPLIVAGLYAVALTVLLFEQASIGQSLFSA